jgi:hypothetical protein
MGFNAAFKGLITLSNDLLGTNFKIILFTYLFIYLFRVLIYSLNLKKLLYLQHSKQLLSLSSSLHTTTSAGQEYV